MILHAEPAGALTSGSNWGFSMRVGMAQGGKPLVLLWAVSTEGWIPPLSQHPVHTTVIVLRHPASSLTEPHSFLLVTVNLQPYFQRWKRKEVSTFARECGHVTWNMAAHFNVASPKRTVAVSDSSLTVLTSPHAAKGSICTSLTSPLSGCFPYWWSG